MIRKRNIGSILKAAPEPPPFLSQDQSVLLTRRDDVGREFFFYMWISEVPAKKGHTPPRRWYVNFRRVIMAEWHTGVFKEFDFLHEANAAMRAHAKYLCEPHKTAEGHIVFPPSWYSRAINIPYPKDLIGGRGC